MSDLAKAIRSCINSPIERPFTPAEDALLAVLDKCEAICGDARHYTAQERRIAAEFEKTIARALGITN